MKSAALALLLLLVFTIVTSIGGAAIGWSIGRLAPSYYRGMFPRLFEDRTLSATEFGLGAGLAQGSTMGMIIGGLLIAVALIVDGARRRRGANVVLSENDSSRV